MEPIQLLEENLLLLEDLSATAESSQAIARADHQDPQDSRVCQATMAMTASRAA